MKIVGKQMVILAIMGLGFHSIERACQYVKAGLAENTGNQWNYSWAWKREELSKLSMGELLEIYDSEYRE